MKVYKCKDYTEVGRAAASVIADVMKAKPECVLGLATGSTPISTYQELISKYEAGELDFSGVKTYNLDEYKGLDGSNDQSYRYFMNNQLFDHVNIDKCNTNVPDGTEPDSEKACAAYEDILKNCGPADVQVLGLGANGHIAFNEPSDHFSEGTCCVDLTESTISANSRFFANMDEVPKQAYTMGIGSIMKAKKILIIVNGEGKRDILNRAFHGPVTPEVPASILQTHPDVVLVGDEGALGENF